MKAFPLTLLFFYLLSYSETHAQKVDARFYADSLIQLFPSMEEQERSDAFISTFSKKIVLKDIEAALEFTELIRKHAIQNSDTVLLAGAEILQSEYMWRNGEYQKGIETALKGVELTSTNKRFDNVRALGLLTIGNIQFFSGSSLEAIEYYKRAATVFKKLDNIQAYISTTSNIGAVYADYGDKQQNSAFLDSALIYLSRVIELKDVAQRNFYLAALGNSGFLYFARREYKKARSIYALWEEEEAKAPNVTSRANQYVTIGATYTKLDAYLKAEEYLNKGLYYAKEIGLKQRVIEYYEELAILMQEKKDYEQALRYTRKSHHLQDSVLNEEKLKAIQEMEVKFQTSEKEKEILSANSTIEKNRQFQRLLIVIILLILVLFITFFLFNRQRFKLKKKLLYKEIDNLRLQINALVGKGSEEINIEIADINKTLEEQLSEREFTILQLVLTNKTNKEIADEVSVSVNTVKYHLKNIYEKLGVSNRKEALQYAIKPPVN